MTDLEAIIKALEAGPGPRVISYDPSLEITTWSEQLDNGDIIVYDKKTGQQCGYLKAVQTPRRDKP